jgi:hypothetical protein
MKEEREMIEMIVIKKVTLLRKLQKAEKLVGNKFGMYEYT